MIEYPLNIKKGGDSVLKRLWTSYKAYVIAFAAIVALVATMWVFNVPCPIKHVTGISCAGCGMSRAFVSAISLNFADAFRYHPLWVIVVPVSIALAILGAKEKKRAAGILVAAVVVVFLAIWIIRIVSGDDIVRVDLADSAIARLFNGR